MSKGVTIGASDLLGPETGGRFAFGLAVGVLCGLLPQYKLRAKDIDFGNLSFWICALLGSVGGALLAVPGALVLTFLGFRRHRNQAAAATATATGDQQEAGTANENEDPAR